MPPQVRNKEFNNIALGSEDLMRPMELKDCAIIIQARMSSKRFTGKMMAYLADMPLVEYIYKRCKSLPLKAVVATSDDKSDDALYKHCSNNNIPVFRGQLDNVLGRYIKAGDYLGASYIIRVCGDTPFFDSSSLTLLLQSLIAEQLDYVSLNKETCAAGFYLEAVTLKALKKTAGLTRCKDDLEHVTKFIINNKKMFSAKFIDVDLNPGFMRNVRLTIDYPEDITLANSVVGQLRDKFAFTSREILDIVSREVR